MILFHGSTDVIKNPTLERGKPNNDYGKGFYCTEDIELAKEWACKNNEEGFVNKYEFDLSQLRVLYLNDKKYNALHWISILLKNRTFRINSPIGLMARDYIVENYNIDISKYDVIVGYRADDSYFSYAEDFVLNTLSLRHLSDAMVLGKLGMQIALVSEKAFSKISFIESMNVERNIYYKKYQDRDTKARSDYREIKQKNEILADDIFVIDIIRKGNEKNESTL